MKSLNEIGVECRTDKSTITHHYLNNYEAHINKWRYDGEIVFNSNMPDGISSKLLDTTKIRELGWAPKIPLREGIERVYNSL